MSNLSAGLKANMQKATGKNIESVALTKKAKLTGKTVLIGAHFAPQVRRALKMVEAHPDNEGRDLKALLGEAINDLCSKYGQPQPYTDD